MSDGFWESEEVMSEEEANVASSNSSIEDEIESYDNDSSTEVDEGLESELEILKNARLRLEQGRLYEMLLKHDLFENVDADQKAISNVQREIRTFIKERLEILVGLRTDPRLKVQSQNDTASGFSDVELKVLKEFVGRVAKPKMEESVRPLASNTNKSLKPVTQSSNIRVNPVKQKTQSRPQAKKQLVEDQGPGLTKAPSEMTLQELKEYNKGLAARQSRKKAAPPAKKIPMPDSNQVGSLYASRVQTDPGQNLVSAIMSKMGKTVGVIENVGDGNGADDGGNDSRM